MVGVLKNEEESVHAGSGCLWSTFATGLGAPAPPVAASPNVEGGANNGGGSFWQLFDQLDFAGASPLDVLLESPDCSMEALLREEEVLQELRARHRGLLERLGRPDAALALIEYITCEPPAGAPQSRSSGLPFVAAQLLSCDVPELFEVWVSPDHPEIMDRFWAYLETPPERVEPVLAGYFVGAAISLVERHPEEVARFCIRKGPEVLLGHFLKQLHSRSLAELLACLCCAEWPARLIFRPESVVERLLDILEHRLIARESQEHAALVLVELLSRGQTLCFADELLGLLTAPSTVDALVPLVLQAEPGGRSSAAAAVMAAAIFHAGGSHRAPNLDAAGSFSSLSPLRGRPAPLEADIHENALLPRSASSRSGSLSAGTSEPLDARCLKLVTSVCGHLPGIRRFLEEAICDTGEAVAIAVSSVLEVMLLLTLLVQARRDVVLEAFRKEEALLPLCVQVLLFHRWSSLLHNAVAALLLEVLRGSDAAAAALFRGFFSSGGLLETLIAEYRRLQAEPLANKRRVGYMGQLQALCCELLDFAGRTPGCGESLASAPGWADVVLPVVENTSRLQAEELGGGVAPEVRALAATGGAWPLGSTDALPEADLSERFSLEILDMCENPATGSPRNQVLPLAEAKVDSSKEDPNSATKAILSPTGTTPPPGGRGGDRRPLPPAAVPMGGGSPAACGQEAPTSPLPKALPIRTTCCRLL